MNKKIERLAGHRAILIDKAARQRDDLASAFIQLHTPMAWASKGLHVLRSLARRPVLVYGAVAGAVAVAVVARPKRWLFILEKGWMAWRLVHAAKRHLDD